MEQPQFRGGWVTFAAVLSGVVGLFNLLSGIAAVTEDDRTETLNEVLYGIDHALTAEREEFGEA